jgi:hypothetical protein
VGKRARSGLLSAPSVQVERDALKADEGAGGRRLFVPGRMSYVRDENLVLIDCVQVVLRSDAWKSGTTTVINTPISNDWACVWTNRMEETIRSEPMLRRMEDIFRTFALARILGQSGDLTTVVRAADFDAKQLLLEDHIVPAVSVPRQ